MSMKPGQTTRPVASMRRRGLDAAGVAAQDAHALVLDRDGAVEAGVAGAVDDESAADEQVEHRGLPSGELHHGRVLLRARAS